MTLRWTISLRHATTALAVLCSVTMLVTTLGGCTPPDWSMCECDWRDNYWFHHITILDSFVGDPSDGGFVARLQSPEHPLHKWVMEQECPHEIHTFLFNQEGKKYAFNPQSIVDLGQEAWRDHNREMIKWACPVGNMVLHFWCVHQYLIKLSDPNSERYDDVDGLNEQLRMQGWYQHLDAMRRFLLPEITSCLNRTAFPFWRDNGKGLKGWANYWAGDPEKGEEPRVSYSRTTGKIDLASMAYGGASLVHRRKSIVPKVKTCTPMKDRTCWPQHSQFEFMSCYFCCDPSRGPYGDERCWNGPFTFARCCQQDFNGVMCEEIRKEEEGCVDCPRSLSYYCNEEHKFRMVKAWHVMNESLYAYNDQLKKLGELEEKTAGLVRNLSIAEARLNASERAHAYQQARLLPLERHDHNRLAMFALARAEASLQNILNVTMPPILDKFKTTSEAQTAAEEALAMAVRTTRDANQTFIDKTRRLRAIQERLPELIDDELPKRRDELRGAEEEVQSAMALSNASCNSSDYWDTVAQRDAAGAAYRMTVSQLEEAKAELERLNETTGISGLTDRRDRAWEALNRSRLASAAAEEGRKAAEVTVQKRIEIIAIQTETCARNESLGIKQELAEQQAMEAREAEARLLDEVEKASSTVTTAADGVDAAKSRGVGWRRAREEFARNSETLQDARENLTAVRTALAALTSARTTAVLELGRIESRRNESEEELHRTGGELTGMLESMETLEEMSLRLKAEILRYEGEVESVESELNPLEKGRSKEDILSDLKEITERIASLQDTSYKSVEGREVVGGGPTIHLTTDCLLAGIKQALSWFFDREGSSGMDPSVRCQSPSASEEEKPRIDDGIRRLMSSAEQRRKELEEELTIEQRRADLRKTYGEKTDQLSEQKNILDDIEQKRTEARERSNSLTSRQSDLTRAAMAAERELAAARDKLKGIDWNITTHEEGERIATLSVAGAEDAVVESRDVLEKYALAEGIVVAEGEMLDRQECLNQTMTRLEAASQESKSKHERLLSEHPWRHPSMHAARAAAAACDFGDTDLREAEDRYVEAEKKLNASLSELDLAEQKYAEAREGLSVALTTPERLKLEERLNESTTDMTRHLEQLRSAEGAYDSAVAACDRATSRLEDARRRFLDLNSTVTALIVEELSVKREIEEIKTDVWREPLTAMQLLRQILRSARSLEEAERYEAEKLRKAEKWRGRYASIERTLTLARQEQLNASQKVNETKRQLEDVHRRLGYPSVIADYLAVRNVTLLHRTEVTYERGNLSEHRALYVNETEKALRLRNELEASQAFFKVKEAEFNDYEQRVESGEVQRPVFSLDL
ncbi:hypothetical protein FOL46_003748 [Perkinsus olseni]|uniref:Uncharacterized protein n=1 Tax=Perkinsus olseni TaxID=32597 RepID=A0A7J6M192_PEROL|nr:hypothetical protein FOL46_003748 [Perkinsus olseni]